MSPAQFDVKTYDPQLYITTVAGIPIAGYADNAMVKWERNESLFDPYVGTQGEVSRAKNANRTGKCTITLAQTSPLNDFLSGIVQKDELTGKGIVPVATTDLGGTSKHVGAMCWIEKPAPANGEKKITPREWVFFVAHYDVWNGGNVGMI